MIAPSVKASLVVTCVLISTICLVSASNFAEDTIILESQPVSVELNAKFNNNFEIRSSGATEDHYLRIGVSRSSIASICNLVTSRKKSYASYIPLEFTNGKRRMIKPASMSLCSTHARGLSARSEFAFRLLDNAQVGHAICPANEKVCGVFLFNSTAKGFQTERYRSTKRAQASQSQARDADGWSSCTETGDTCSCTGQGCMNPPWSSSEDPGSCAQNSCPCCNYDGYNGCCNTINCETCTATGSTCTCTDGSGGTTTTSCFPANALATLPSGATKPMSELCIGDSVLAVRPDGTTFFDQIYMFGHKDVSVSASFVKIETASGKFLRLSHDHYVPVVRSGKDEVIASAEAQVGDLVHVTASKNLLAVQMDRVVKISIIQDVGLFNPYTLRGSIVVDGVVASSHSGSALDGVFKALHISIPVGYQALFAPVRTLYRTVGPESMRMLEPIVESVAVVMNGKASIARTVGLTAGAVAVAFILRSTK